MKPICVRFVVPFACTVLGAALLAGCGKNETAASPSGALDVVLETDLSVPKDIDHVTLDVKQEGAPLLHVDSDIGSGALLLPARFEVQATGAMTPVTVRAVAFKSGAPRIERDAVTPIPSGRTGELRIPLEYLCEGSAQAEADGGIDSTCPGGQTCVLGSCSSSAVSSSAVPTVGAPDGGSPDASTAPDGGASGGECFDVASCFGSPTPAALDAATCTITLPSGTNLATVNVALQLPAGSAGICSATACWVALTGWAANGLQIQLPAAACSSASAQGGILVVSSACNTESATLPPCGSWSSATTPAPQPPPATGPIITSCSGPATQACGKCGTQTRTCMNGAWSSWTACGGEGTCAAGATQACTGGGSQTCEASCQWGACTCPSGEMACGDAGTCTSASDPHSCGACNNDCTDLANVSGPTSCSGTQCVVPQSSCAAGFDDCNGDPADGCETALNDAAHCGACATSCAAGMLCSTTSGSPPACTSTCAHTVCGSACVDTSSDPTHCGACGTSCTAPAHGTATCTGGTCGVTCNAGYTLCNGACVDLTSDTNHCGACSTACSSPANGTAACTQSNCAVACSSGYTLCGGACVDLTTNASHCGSCNNVCDETACQGGTCGCSGEASQPCGACGTQTRTCQNGTWSNWSACTGQSGCTNGTTQTCDVNGTQTCTASCTWGSCVCNQGFTMCGSTCMDTSSDSTHCGPSCTACGSGLTCQSGSCVCAQASASQPCGNCGTQTQTCQNGVWSAWSACSGQGVCAANATRSCGAGGSQTCSATCQWGDCESGTPVALATSPNTPMGLAVDDTNIYWTNIGTSPNFYDGTIMMMPKAGGTVTTLASGQDFPKAITVHGGYVYWVNYDAANSGGAQSGAVSRVSTSGGTVTVIASGQAFPWDVAADDNNAYWTCNESNVVRSAPIGGGTAKVIAQNCTNSGLTTCENPAGIAIDATNVYFADQLDYVWKVPLGGGTPAVVGNAANYGAGPAFVALNGSTVFWSDASLNQFEYADAEIQSAGISATTLNNVATTNLTRAWSIAVDSSNVYWTEYVSPGSVKSVSQSGGSITTLASGRTFPYSIAVDATNVYWTEYTSGGSIMTMTK